MQEFPLVFFTVLAQAVAASFIFLQYLRVISVSYQFLINKKQLTNIFIILLILLGISGAVALTHLGTPLRAPNVLLGLTHLSAMSIEIITISIFGAMLFSLIFLERLNINNVIKIIINVIATIFAFAQIIAISNVYYLDTVYLWNSEWTLINFISSGFISGSLLIALIIKIVTNQEDSRKFFNQLWSVIFIISMAVNTGYLMHFFTQLVIENIILPQWIKLFLFIKMMLIVCAFTWVIRSAVQIKTVSLILVTLLVFSAELLGRAVFYELIKFNHL
ncbi:dimethyl sulfoxide reductase anchor subunit family protein [Providencia huaxiensis]|uniref:dimethyl sulfoxide reductase anchor subunit family protein n=1 Tax=Providencia huaxiensis TaxID=2027290 RepID=UPI001B372ACF|nr:DmsC/YnfH family molybdoenzyme membrane anchor subunit [Providencia huaxiensis]MBQ0532802.1 dimethyl sulfoxide reductase anchor subunit [Providencia huaxiensis]MBQ0587268.1 dimethyl sulfoxide reductase anchor subunit [Providencia huaxiensis]MDI7238929.1 dimethyl sulfoxide reductase anchor subunit [Providencia huaxiensis]